MDSTSSLGGPLPMGMVSQSTPPKRKRKSRGKGLRTKTGCLTCRSRHKKCDEKRPTCGPCNISSRDCVFPDDKLRALGPPPGSEALALVVAAAAEHQADSSSSSSVLPRPGSRADDVPTPGTVFSMSPVVPRNRRLDSLSSHGGPSPGGPNSGMPTGMQLQGQSPYSQPRPPSSMGAMGESYHRYDHVSPSNTVTSEPWTADLASTRWLDLLATDAAHSGFSLAPSPVAAPPSDAGTEAGSPATPRSVAAGPLGPGAREMLRPRAGPGAGPVAPNERKSWQVDQDILLGDHDAMLFRHFAERSALWLDLMDPQKHFSTYAIRLAIRNPGLMRAILALSARHLSLLQARPGTSSSQHPVYQHPDIPADSVAAEQSEKAIRYYYETLHYVQNALQYNSYTHSEQLLATALIISAYEMLDESDGRGNWQRHLKGVFWIQRGQDVNGGSGGLRQAVWWAWLRQDVWAAFREKRRCLSFWRPSKDYPDLTQHDMADRAVYLLSQAVNYSAKPEPAAVAVVSGAVAPPEDPEVLRRRSEQGENLLAMLERWRGFLGEKFRPLPGPAPGPGDVFRPIWIHPPQFGVALQVYSFAKILIMLHRPAVLLGLNGYLRVQRTLSEAVETICGIAMELRDEGCQILSAQCLYGAGLCVQDPAKREKIISMIEDCEARTGWPMAPWRHDLRQEWTKVDSEYHEGPA